MILVGECSIRRKKSDCGIGSSELFLLPLAVSAISGIDYSTGEACDMSEDTLDLLMSIHEGDWMGKEIKPFYISVLGLGLVLATVSG